MDFKATGSGFFRDPGAKKAGYPAKFSRRAAGVVADDAVLLRWLLTTVAASRAAHSLTDLDLSARIPPGPQLDAMLAPLVAASANTLRLVRLGVAPIADDGVGKRRRMAAALVSALPLAKVEVFRMQHF